MIDAPVTRENLRLLDSWWRWEGGHTKNDARYNWLNTTSDSPGAVRSINSVGVKAFDSFQSGVNALAATMLNGRYNDVVTGLRSGNPYAHDITAGLSTWVSGSPTGNLSYAQKVLGGKGTEPKRPSKTGPGSPAAASGSLGAPPPQGDFFGFAFDDDPEFLSLLRSMPGPTGPKLGPQKGHQGAKLGGPGITIPANWSGTHVTDGLGWGTKTATDIMGKPGTPVRLPEGGIIMRHGSAQGGESLWVKTDSGKVYWLGHVYNSLPAGRRFKAGDVLTYISPDHPAPHVHVDRRG
jgi:hypothetical protein